MHSKCCIVMTDFIAGGGGGGGMTLNLNNPLGGAAVGQMGAFNLQKPPPGKRKH